MTNHTKTYIICATPRSGTTLLCDLLADTGITGKPDSFFRFQSISWWTDYFKVSAVGWADEHEFDRSYLAAAIEEGTNGTDVFGMRLMWESMVHLQSRLDVFHPGLPSDHARFQAAFGSPLYIHLSREDKVAQAVSLTKAEQTGLWHVESDGTERERLKPAQPAAYDSRSLSEELSELEAHDAAWTDWFSRHDIEPVRITYEMLSADPQATLATILSALGLDPAIANTVRPRTAKLGDSESQDWITRFRAELRSSS